MSTGTTTEQPNVREWALRYATDFGFYSIAVPYLEKNPNRTAWQNERHTVQDIPQHFNGHKQNIGILLGAAQEGCDPPIDVDLDAPEACRLAHEFLPTTGLVSGRKSKPQSHFLYTCTQPPKARQRQDPTDNTMLVELRGLSAKGTTGEQTIVYPSVRERDPKKDPPDYEPERVIWHSYNEPSKVDAAEIVERVDKLAAAALLVRHYPGVGGRHTLHLALAGGLLRAQWAREDVRYFARVIAIAASDEELEDRLACVNTTVDKLEAGENVTGWPTLAGMLGERVVQKVREWLGIQTARRDGKEGAEAVAHDRGEPCTDMGNAERLVRYFGDRIRHSAELGWLYYDGRQWARDEAPVREFAKLTVRLIYGEAQRCANEARREALGKHAWRSESAGAVAAMLTLAATDSQITIRPDELDSDPWLFNCANGTVDLRTGTLLPHNPGRLISKMSPVEYDISAGAPIWARFVADVFAGSKGVAEFMRRSVGYSLTATTTWAPTWGRRKTIRRWQSLSTCGASGQSMGASLTFGATSRRRCAITWCTLSACSSACPTPAR